MTLNPQVYAFGIQIENTPIVIKILICYFYLYGVFNRNWTSDTAVSYCII